MNIRSAITVSIISICSLIAGANVKHTATNEPAKAAETIVATAESDFEKAVSLIKKYEGLHQPKHWPLIGYGHRVLPGEKYSRSRALSEKEADALLRKDLLKNCAVFRQFGADSLILGVLAYNIGSGATLRSSVTRKLKSGDRNIYDSYVAHSKYRGKTNSQIKRRRIEEFETLFIKDLSKHNSSEETIHNETETETGIETPHLLSNLYTPAMQYPLECTPQLRSADKPALIAFTGEARIRRRGNKEKYNKPAGCISKFQQYYWL